MVIGKTLVKCPECDNTFHTRKTDETQCRECGERFQVRGNVIEV